MEPYVCSECGANHYFKHEIRMKRGKVYCERCYLFNNGEDAKKFLLETKAITQQNVSRSFYPEEYPAYMLGEEALVMYYERDPTPDTNKSQAAVVIDTFNSGYAFRIEYMQTTN